MTEGIRRADVGGGIELAYERFGDPADPPLPLVMGLATQMLGSPAYELDEPALRERAGRSFDRAYDPAGVARQQFLALRSSGDRTPRLRELRLRALVILVERDEGERLAA